MLKVHLCKPAMYKLKILGVGKFEYYKSVGGTTKRGGGAAHDFWLKFSGGKTLEETMNLQFTVDKF